MSNASFDTKYKNLCNDKPTYVYFTNLDDGKFVSGSTPFEIKNCENACDNEENCHAFFNKNDYCILYKNDLNSSGLDNNPNIKYISCDNKFLPSSTIKELTSQTNMKKGNNLYVNTNYYKKNKDKFEYLNPQLKQSKIITNDLKKINDEKKKLANTSDSRNFLYFLYDNIVNRFNDVANYYDLSRNYLNSHLVNKNTNYSIDTKNNDLDNEKNLNYIKYINKLNDKIKTNLSLDQQKVTTERSFTTTFLYYIVLALIMTIAIVTIIVYVMAPGVISDLTLACLLIGLIGLMYFLHFILKI